MDMILPLQELGYLSHQSSLWIALFIGIGFGIFLEQGGMGSAAKISGQFYWRDLSVLKIMLSAIVTAAMGLFWFARLGWLDYGMVFVEPTFIWPQLVGGLLFGLGFVTGGLCPGTSCVAAASGRIDGLVLLLGLLIGIFIFNEAFSLIEAFYRSGSVGRSLLPDVLHISNITTLSILVLLAIAAFAVAELIEKRVRQ